MVASRIRCAFFALSATLWAGAPENVLAHGFGGRIDLPVPLYLYLFGGGAVVALSFILLGFLPERFTERLGRYPRYDLMRLWWFRAAASDAVLIPLKALVAAVFVCAVAGGIWGEQNAAFNLLPTTVWVLFAVGVTFFSALIGNMWSVLNPFRTLFEYASATLHIAGISLHEKPMPAWTGAWSAAALFFAFRWIENVSLVSSQPRTLSLFILCYAGIAFFGMARYGTDTWIRRGDPFSMFFGLLSLFSITEKDGRALYLRPPAVGLISREPSFSDVAFILLMLSSVAADGMFATPLLQNVFASLQGSDVPWYVVGTVGLLGLYAAFSAAYWIFSAFTGAVSGSVSPTADIAKRFIFSLLPIAIAYEVAHYASTLAIEGQRILYLLSDPFGRGWDMFGTAGYQIRYTVLDLKMLWHVQVGLIVLGHVIAVVIAHAVAERFFKDSRTALISQYPMLALMVAYSCLSLWIMAQPVIVGE